MKPTNDQLPESSNKKQQFIIVNCKELYLITLFYELFKYPSRLWAHNEIEVGLSDEESTIIQYDLGWVIRISGEPDEIGRFQIKYYDIGALISYWPKKEDGWSVVNEFMDKLFERVKLDGYTVVPRNKDPIEVQIRELRIKHQKSFSPLVEDDGVSHRRGKRKNSCDDLLPKEEATRDRWKRIYRIVQKKKQEYLEEFKDGASMQSSGKLADFQVAIADKLKIRIGEKTLRKIIKAGDRGCLR